MYCKAIITVQILWFCRSEAFVNLAVNGIATQKGVYGSYDASKAIDGNYNQSFNGGSCCHTAAGQLSAWWRLDLRKTAYIHRVVIYYREDQWDRLSGYTLFISNSSNPKYDRLCYEDRPPTYHPNVVQNITCGMTGRYVVFFNERAKPEAYVELCEVEVFAYYPIIARSKQ
ncbi:Hypothetical predicted protein [Mytilus galloprovincialis]|nr:Hypothetical predicted protein [Mytilus galloprovincialis]